MMGFGHSYVSPTDKWMAEKRHAAVRAEQKRMTLAEKITMMIVNKISERGKEKS